MFIFFEKGELTERKYSKNIYKEVNAYGFCVINRWIYFKDGEKIHGYTKHSLSNVIRTLKNKIIERHC